MAGNEEGAGEGLGVGVDLLAHLPGDPVPALEDLHEEALHGRLPAVAEVAGGGEGGLGFGHGGGSAAGWGERWPPKNLNPGEGEEEEDLMDLQLPFPTSNSPQTNTL